MGQLAQHKPRVNKARAFAPLAPAQGPDLGYDEDFDDRLDQMLSAAHRRGARHWGLMLSFAAWVVAPLVIAAWYFLAQAAPQYASHVGFVVRSEDMQSPLSMLGGLADLPGSEAADAAILNNFVQSQDILLRVAQVQDLSVAFNSEQDPVFSLGHDQRVEALLSHWKRRVTVYLDTQSGMIEVRVIAFDAAAARAIATQIFDESARLVNQLSQQAREDATRFSKAEAERAFDRLRKARQALLAFQARVQIIDPRADIRGQMAVLQSLQSKLVNARVDLALLQENQRPNASKLAQAMAEIAVLNQMVQQERDRLGQVGAEEGYADVLAEFEALSIEREFAETTYLAAQAAHDAALAEAQRKTRYLARYLGPTIAETAEYPKSGLWLLGLAAVLLGSWGICAVGFYAMRDRRRF